MISKETLSKILGVKVAHYSVDFDIIYVYEESPTNPLTYNASCFIKMNLYTLANKCRVMAKGMDVIDEGTNVKGVMYTYPHRDRWVCCLDRPYEFDFEVHWKECFNADTEYEAVFKAFEWLIERE
jgi:hypothetical protein